MSEHLATFSGAGKVITPGYNYGTDRHWAILSVVFEKEVLDNTGMAWYVDHYTENPERYRVRYLSQDPMIFWTNENINERDPRDLANTMWGPDDVAEWFSTDINSNERPYQTYRYVVRFRTRDDEQHILTLGAHDCALDGASGHVWERYVEQGVRGALEPLLSEFASLEAIEVHAI